MNPKVLIKEIIEDIKILPAKDLKTVAKFVDFVKDKDLEEEILSSKKIIKAVKASQKAWKERKSAEFVDWEELKKKYHL